MANLNVAGVITENGQRVYSENYKPKLTPTSSSYTAYATSGALDSGQVNLVFIDEGVTTGTKAKIEIGHHLDSNQAITSMYALGQGYLEESTYDNQRIWVLSGYSYYNDVITVYVDRREGDTSSVTTVRVSYTVTTFEVKNPTWSDGVRLNVTGHISSSYFVGSSWATPSRVCISVPNFTVHSFYELYTTDSVGGDTANFSYTISGYSPAGYPAILTSVYATGRPVAVDAYNAGIWQLKSWEKSGSTLKIEVGRSVQYHNSPVRIVLSYIAVEWGS